MEKVKNNINELIVDGVKPEQLENLKELQNIYDFRKDFYKKAFVGEYSFSNGTQKAIYLKSYNTIVACIWLNQIRIYGYFSQTTARHIREFGEQNGFDMRKISVQDMKNTCVYSK